MKEQMKFRVGAWLIIAIACAIMLCLGGNAFANTAGVTFGEQYRWHGFELYNKSYVHPNVSATVSDIDIGVVGHVDDAEMDDLEYWDSAIGYDLPGLEGIVSAGYNYLILPNEMDLQEISGTILLPGNLRYTMSHVIPDNSCKGQIHVVGIDIPFGNICDPNAVTAMLTAEATYNDGVNPFGNNVVHEWTHMMAGLNINVPMGDFILQPAVYYQHTFEEMVEQDKNRTWYGLSLLRRF